MRFLIAGGCKNGKSTTAQYIAAAQASARVYVATMRPQDEEDRARILRHQAERAGLGFETAERHRRIEDLVGQIDKEASILLDSATALLAAEMFGPNGEMDAGAGERVKRGLMKLVDAFAHIVVVTDTICADAILYGVETEAYRRALADVDRALAARMDGVIEMVFGRPVLHKGDGIVAELVEKAAMGIWDGDGAVYGDPWICPLG